MNDFTKEELYDLLSWGDSYVYYDLESDIYKMHEPLLTKLQSLIDNYCEHGYMTAKKGVITCDDCGTVL